MSIDLNSVVSSTLHEQITKTFAAFNNFDGANEFAFASPISIAIAVFSVIGTLVVGVSYFPQTLKTMKDRDTANVSFLLFFITGIATFALFLYGVGLVSAPQNDLSFLIAPADKVTGASVQDISALKIENGILEVVDKQKHVLLFNYEEWAAGYLVPGIALIIGEIFASVTAFMVAFVKLGIKLKAKANGLSESEYYNKFIKPTLKLKGDK